MSSEVRYILFNAGEVARTIVQFCARRRVALPPGSIVDFRIIVQPRLEVALTVAPDDVTKGRVRESLSEDGLTAALVLYCVNNRIPVPMKAGKRIMVTGEGIILALALGLEDWQTVNFSKVTPTLFDRPKQPKLAAGERRPRPVSSTEAALWRRALDEGMEKAKPSPLESGKSPQD